MTIVLDIQSFGIGIMFGIGAVILFAVIAAMSVR